LFHFYNIYTDADIVMLSEKAFDNHERKDLPLKYLDEFTMSSQVKYVRIFLRGG
jgi:hypothetical protein